MTKANCCCAVAASNAAAAAAAAVTCCRVSTHVAIIVTDEQTCFLATASSRRVSDVTVTSEKIEENVQ